MLKPYKMIREWGINRHKYRTFWLDFCFWSRINALNMTFTVKKVHESTPQNDIAYKIF